MRMTLFKPYELLYYERDNKTTTRCVEEFASMRELYKRIAEIMRVCPDKTFVFEY